MGKLYGLFQKCFSVILNYYENSAQYSVSVREKKKQEIIAICLFRIVHLETLNSIILVNKIDNDK